MFLAGTFNDWRPDATPMQLDAEGTWSVPLELEPGRYEYKFVVDGEWRAAPESRADLACTGWIPNAFGTMNRVLEVPVEARTWAIVLAGGEGSRLRTLTTTRAGVSVPKQFCSLSGGPSLLRQTVERAAAFAPRERILVVVSAAHRSFWRRQLADLPTENVVVQPENRGTAPGILLPALRIRGEDPGADVVVLPSDHYVADEATLREAFRGALRGLRSDPARIVLLGVTPDAADSQYGWIVPGPIIGGATHAIDLFVEKPPAERAAELFDRGALWSSFLFACQVSSLLEAFELSEPCLLRAFTNESARGDAGEERLEELYAKLAPADFSRDVLAHVAHRLGVVAVPPCGWSDLGTPERVASVLSASSGKLRSGAARDPISKRMPILARAITAL